MKTALVAVTAFLTAALVVLGVLTHSALSADSSKIEQLHSQVGVMQASVNGSHRDLITCGDIQKLSQYIDGIVAPQGDIGQVEFLGPDGAIAGSLPLPPHCINQ